MAKVCEEHKQCPETVSLLESQVASFKARCEAYEEEMRCLAIKAESEEREAKAAREREWAIERNQRNLLAAANRQQHPGWAVPSTDLGTTGGQIELGAGDERQSHCEADTGNTSVLRS